MRKLVPLHKQSKKQRKEYNAKQRGSWNGISPVTRMPVRMSTVLHLLPLRKCRRTTTVTKQVGTLNCVLWRPTNEIERISSAL